MIRLPPYNIWIYSGNQICFPFFLYWLLKKRYFASFLVIAQQLIRFGSKWKTRLILIDRLLVFWPMIFYIKRVSSRSSRGFQPGDSYSSGMPTLVFSFGPWGPVVANRRQLPFLMDSVRGRMPLLRSPDRKPGLADITRERSRVKEFRLQDGILYSYLRDMRFVLVICLALGFSIWWAMAPVDVSPLPSNSWKSEPSVGGRQLIGSAGIGFIFLSLPWAEYWKGGGSQRKGPMELVSTACGSFASPVGPFWASQSLSLTSLWTGQRSFRSEMNQSSFFFLNFQQGFRLDRRTRVFLPLVVLPRVKELRTPFQTKAEP